MIDLTLSLADLAEADDLLTTARNTKTSDKVDLLCFQSTLKLTVVGREHTCPAVIAVAGAASIPIALLSRIRKAAETYPEPTFRLRLEAGQVFVNRSSIKHPDVKLTAGSARPIDIPDDAPVADLLAIKLFLTVAQLRDSNLAERVQEAEKILKRALIPSQDLLEFLSADQLRDLINRNLEAKAKAIQTNLASENQQQSD